MERGVDIKKEEQEEKWVEIFGGQCDRPQKEGEFEEGGRRKNV